MRLVTALAAAVGLSGPLVADTLAAPRLGAATNFGQGWQPEALEASGALPVTLFRDAVYWSDVETGGAYTFSGPRETWPDLLPARGAGAILVVNNGHPDHDGGHTPLSPEAVRAFADYAAEAVRRFPAIRAVEVGNEMNSDTFVSGPGWDAGLEERARSYAALLSATAAAVRAVRPEVRILGGAAHSVPLAWFGYLFEAGAAPHMDALVIHPYGIAPELLARQIDLLRRSFPEARDLPLAVTEFGTPDARDAPAHLVKTYCQLALSGASDAIWYPLADRGDGLVPLIDATGQATGAGRAFAQVRRLFEGKEVAPLAIDPFTHGCRFGPDTVVIWGAPRPISAPSAEVRDAEGRTVPAEGLALSMDRPLILTAPAPLVPGRTLLLGDQPVVADSLHQFAYPDEAGAPFRYLARAGGQEAPMELRPGQDRGGVPWSPYLATRLDGMARASADWVLPGRPPGGPVDIVLRYTAPRPQRVEAEVRVDPASRSLDGVRVRVSLGARVLAETPVVDETVLHLGALELAAGATLDVAVGPGDTAQGDVTGLRVILRRAGG